MRDQSLWSPIERSCLSLFQRTTNTRTTLLQIHAFMLRHSIETNVNLYTKLVTACASLACCTSYARKLFDERPDRDDTFLCNSMIKSHLGMHQFSDCFKLYRDLKRETCFVPESFTFVTLAKCCSLKMATWEGLGIHSEIMKTGFCSNLYVSTGLIDMYAKVRRMECARKLFDEMSERSEVTWTALICGYVRCGDIIEARKLFDKITVRKDVAAYNVMIDGYVKLEDMASARKYFEEMSERNVISWTTMIDGYCNGGDIVAARSLFNSMPEKNLYSWNVMIGGYCKNKQPQEALKLFHEMQSSTKLEPDNVTILSILPAIADLGTLDLAGWVYRYVRRKKIDRETKVCTALVDMYAKCGEIGKARKVFYEMPEKEIASWNALINGCAVNGCANEALTVFSEMQSEGLKPNDITMMGVLSACNHGGLVEEGKRWFSNMEKLGLTPKIQHYGCLVDLLGKAGKIEEAEKLIESMPYEANDIIMSSFLSACGHSKDVKRAERILKHAVTKEPMNDGNYIILRNMYAAEERWGDADEVKRVMRRNKVSKEVGCSVIEINSRVFEFIAGDTMHPQQDKVNSILGQLRIHMRGLDSDLT
ncbi:hypothetical protein ACFE04_026375 [Oxalis oulophora]